jgi:rhodanese-related sulfurtransferase
VTKGSGKVDATVAGNDASRPNSLQQPAARPPLSQEEIARCSHRDPHEWQNCNLEMHGSTLIPLGEFTAWMHELNSEEEIVVPCKVGGRSAEADHIFKQAGFKKIKNLTGGILAWAAEADQTLLTD